MILKGFPQVILERDTFMVLYKPAFWIVNEAETTKGQRTIQEWLRGKDFSISKNFDLRSGIVHRLDKETSGLLIVAKESEAFFDLQSQFKNRQVEKRYRSLLHGKVEPDTGTIDVPIGRLPWNRKRFGVLQGGRSSYSKYNIDEYYKKGDEVLTLVNFMPKTGRTHQIRVHAKHIGHPVVADEFYAGRKTARKDRGWCPRLFLHASKIKFHDPKDGKPVVCELNLPDDLRNVLQVLEKFS